MIRINDEEITNYKISVSMDPFEGRINGKKIKSKAPYIKIKSNERIIDIETIYPIGWLNDLKVGTKIDFKNYISEILFIEDGFLYNYINNIEESILKKIDNNKYNLYIKGKEDFEIELDEIIEMEDIYDI